MEYSLARKRYMMQKWHCEKGRKLDKNRDAVEMRLTFEEWASIWVRSGKYEQRGRHDGSYCMMRIDDIGHYEIGNVRIGLNRENTKESNKGRKHTDEHRRRNSEARIGVPRSEETKKKIGDYNRGTKRSEATKQKMREAQLGKRVSEETKAKLRAHNLGKKLPTAPCDICGRVMAKRYIPRHKKAQHV